MEYDFSGLCADQLAILNKRLHSVNKKFLKEYLLALNVINHPKANEHREETIREVENLLHDQVGKCEIFYTETLNKVQRTLAAHL